MSFAACHFHPLIIPVVLEYYGLYQLKRFLAMFINVTNTFVRECNNKASHSYLSLYNYAK
jgi:hypothetical protein